MVVFPNEPADLPEPPHGGDAPPDLTPLAWVIAELRRSLDAATKAMRRYVRDAAAARGTELAAADASQLRLARQQLHQAMGALEMVGQGAPALLLRAMEAVAQQCVNEPERCSESGAATVEQASFALVEYLEAVLAGKPASAVALFPQYKAVQELAAADRVHPADLFTLDWRWLDAGGALPPAAPQPCNDEARARLDPLVLKLVRGGDAEAARALHGEALGFAAAQARPAARAFWQITAAAAEAIALGLLPVDLYLKRALTRVLLQFSSLARGEDTVSDRLAQDLLFFCAQAAPANTAAAPTLAAVRAAYGLSDARRIDYDTALYGRHDPALLAQARKRIAAAREAWSHLSGGEGHKLRPVADQFNLVADSLLKLHPPSAALARGLTGVMENTLRTGEAPGTETAMEVATSVLYLEAAVEDLSLNDPQLADRMARLSQRLEQVLAGQPAQPLEPWMEELYRRVSDRQTMGSVVGELRATLAELEGALDPFFRQPADKSVLARVPAQLQQMRGVLSVLGLDRAGLAVARMRATVEELLATDVQPQLAQATFDALGNNLGALGFLIDMLNYQPALAKKLFVYDDATGELRPLMGRAHPQPVTPPAPTLDLVQRALDVAATAAAEHAPVPELREKLGAIATSATLAEQPALAAAAAAAAQAVAADVPDAAVALNQLANAAAMPPAEPQADALSLAEPVQEDDLRGIFLDEAREVAEGGRRAIAVLRQEPANLDALTTLRRSFHTLKGSSRMVGLAEFGEAAWAAEQLMNVWLADQKPATPPLLTVTGDALDGLARWVDDIAAGSATPWSAAPFRASAEALRLEDRVLPLGATPAEPPLPESRERPALELPALDLPSLDLPSLDLPVLDVPTLDLAEPPAAALPAFDPLPELAAFAQPPTPDLPPPEAGLIDFDDLPLEPLPDEFPAPATEPTPLAPDVDIASLFGDLDLSLPEGTVIEPPVELHDIDLSALASLAAPAADNAEPAPPLPPPELHTLEPFTEPELAPAADAELVANLQPVSDTAPVADLEPLAFIAPVAAAPAAPTEAPSEAPQPEPPAVPGDGGDDAPVKVIDGLRIGLPLYNVYLNEADEWSRHLSTALGEWALELHRPLPDEAVAMAHSLAGSSATVGFTALSGLAKTLEQALQHTRAQGTGTAERAHLFMAVAEDIRRLLHQFAAGFLKEPNPTLLAALHTLELARNQPQVSASAEKFAPDIEAGEPHEAAPRPLLRELPPDADDELDATDAVDIDLFPIFEEEAVELLPQLGFALRQWTARPDNGSARTEVLRVLHTLKGSARLAGALRLGELAHLFESEIESLGTEATSGEALAPLMGRFDALQATFDRLRVRDAQRYEALTATEPPAAQALPPEALPAELAEPAAPAAPRAALGPVTALDITLPADATGARHAAGRQLVRVRAQLLERLLNQAGEVMLTRARMEAEIGQLRGSLKELTGNLDRLRQQLRDVELQAETQMESRLAQARETQQTFDPLEFDRFTRVQELTRMMAESVNDVGTVQRHLQRTVELSEDELAAQARQTRELQRDLLRTRMLEFEGISERLYRVVRQSAKELGKQVALEIVGGSIEMDRAVLDRMTPAFEHLLRNAVVHGVESPETRLALGKSAVGQITVRLRQEGNDVSVEFQDDGAGLDLEAIRARAQAMGLARWDEVLDDGAAAQFIFRPGFSTAQGITELAGRGIGMDVVRSEVNALGGRIETHSLPGHGSSFRLVLPLTTAVTQVVMLRMGRLSIGMPASVVELVRRTSAGELAAAYAAGQMDFGGEAVPFFWGGALLQDSPRSTEAPGKSIPVVIVRSAGQRVALHVDEVLGHQEVVVKNLGPQLSRLPGLSGMTLLASGAVALIYNPVALATVYGAAARGLMAQLPQADGRTPQGAHAAGSAVPLVLVVDDSITVRRVTQRLLQREGYRVALAADGLQALKALADERPALVLSDIEMPRMDGFDLLRTIRNDATLAGLPVVMITSRMAQKHRDHARELGADHYLGKPYSEDELLALVKSYGQRAETTA